MEKYSLVDLIQYIDPRDLSYEEWLAIGMGLKEDGYTAADWDSWSKADRERYHNGECQKKWDSFHGMAGTRVTAGTIVQMAKDRGWKPDPGMELDWDAEISTKDELVVVEKEWLEGKEIHEPGADWDLSLIHIFCPFLRDGAKVFASLISSSFQPISSEGVVFRALAKIIIFDCGRSILPDSILAIEVRSEYPVISASSCCVYPNCSRNFLMFLYSVSI